MVKKSSEVAKTEETIRRKGKRPHLFERFAVLSARPTMSRARADAAHPDPSSLSSVCRAPKRRIRLTKISRAHQIIQILDKLHVGGTHPAKAPPARTSPALIAILYQKAGEPMGSPCGLCGVVAVAVTIAVHGDEG